VNVVVLKGINDDLAPFLRFAQEWPVDVRFIEYMPIGPLASQTYYLPAKEIKDRLRTLAPLEIAETPIGWGPAQHYCRTPGAVGRLAVLAPVSEHYCPLCNRLRLTADGHLRLCLFSDLEIDLKPALRPEPNESMIEQCFRRATEEKPRCMPSEYGEKHRCMVQIGG
jgi:cyclic pyranopterin phosphate synthase